LNKLKQIVKNYLGNFSFFYSHLRYRIFFSVALSILVGVLDGLGLTMFIPLLNMVDPSNKGVDPDTLGGLSVVVESINSFGISLNLVNVLAFMCSFFILKGLAIMLEGFYQVKLQQFFIKKIRLNYIRGINNLSYKTFVLSDVGQIQNSLTGEVDRLSRAYTSYFLAFQQAVMVAVYMVFAFSVNAQFAVLVGAGGALSNIIYKTIFKKTKGASVKLTSFTNVFQGLIIQHVANYKYLKATGSLSGYSKKLVEGVDRIEENNRKIGVLSAIVKGSREPLMITVVCTIIFIQTSLLGSSLGPILISLVFFYRALVALMGMQTAYNYFLGNAGSLQNMTEFTKMLNSNSERTGKQEVSSFNKELVLKDVSFAYNDTPILKNININISKNETTAFVGESGSGKTTLVNMLAGLFKADSGEIYIDGTKREDINIISYQKRVGYITQDPVIFNDTLFNNVTFWDKPSKENIARFEDAVRRASLWDFMNNHIDRENAQLGNSGVNLSGGQKQRISIARELYKEIDILILDEATSALDSETERAIQENIEELKGKYTILIVAHRLSTIKDADRIVYMKDGEIVHIDNFKGLVENVPSFKRMVELQGID
jgi:ABC-type multidrug transport system fused ATPase/permease subunit